MIRRLILAAFLVCGLAQNALAQSVVLQAIAGGTAVYLGGTTTSNTAVQVPTTNNSVNQWVMTSAATGGTPSIIAGGSSGDVAEPAIFGTNGTGTLSFDTSGSTVQFQITHTPNAVNNLQVTGSTGTNQIPLTPVGTGATLGFQLAAKSTGTHYLGGTTPSNASVQVPTVTNAVNQIVLTPAATGSVPTVGIGGSSADANRSIGVAGAGTGLVLLGQSICTVTGASGQTCNGQRGIVTTNSLTTAAATAATYTINNNSVTSSSLIACTNQGYSGTYVTNGYPIIMDCTPGAGTITVDFVNTHAANALNGTMKFGFAVLN